MTRTTPPRPVDVERMFPELEPLARTANRHPLGMTFGDNGGFYVFYCADCPGLPLASWFDCG